MDSCLLLVWIKKKEVNTNKTSTLLSFVIKNLCVSLAFIFFYFFFIHLFPCRKMALSEKSLFRWRSKMKKKPCGTWNMKILSNPLVIYDGCVPTNCINDIVFCNFLVVCECVFFLLNWNPKTNSSRVLFIYFL